MQEKNKKLLLFSIAGTLLFVFVLDIFFLWQCGFWEWLNAKDIAYEQAAVSRNRGGALLAIIGLGLLVWGRYLTYENNKQEQEKIKLSKKSNTNERYEKAARMLAEDIISVRIAGCRALRELAKDDIDMLSPCAGLLLAYIKEPHLSTAEKVKLSEKLEKIGTYENIQELAYEDEDLIHIFDIEKPLRNDIQEAINGVSFVYQHAHDIGKPLNGKIIPLPSYFRENLFKGPISLPNAVFQFQHLDGAYLESANLENARLEYVALERADFSNANLRGLITSEDVELSGVTMRNADITNADLDCASGLTEENILSAKWGIDKNGNGMPPDGPVGIDISSEIKKWYSEPHYDRRNN